MGSGGGKLGGGVRHGACDQMVGSEGGGVAGIDRREAVAFGAPVRARFVGAASPGDLGDKENVKRVRDGKRTNF